MKNKATGENTHTNTQGPKPDSQQRCQRAMGVVHGENHATCPKQIKKTSLAVLQKLPFLYFVPGRIYPCW